jgi:hypothetical protein
MPLRRIKPIIFLLTVLLAVPIFLEANTRISPEFDLYYTHSTIFRSRTAAGLTWDKQDEQFSTGVFEYDLDIGLMPFFRRYVFKDPDSEKAKRLTLRLGYQYFPDLVTGSSAIDEHRGLADVTFRIPIYRLGLLVDRNRFEYRHVGKEDSTRYRNRVRLERGVKFWALKATPYVNAEFFYDGKVDEWNRNELTAGVELPWRFSTILEFYYTKSHLTSATDSETYGVTLQKHL